VVNFPEAAQRALNDGHTICSHTWSHPQMTSLTSEEVVAQLYWTQKAIKEAMGITPKCWRPPYGDVDDRVRAIAWQMGMRTILWDQDSNDWNMVKFFFDLVSLNYYH
jgi:peptidoglycan/xylan/chitin deacetylase (PgdA/CDA1 family)